MKILLLSDCNLHHTIKWAKALSDRSITVKIFSLRKCETDIFDEDDFITVHSMGFDATMFRADTNVLTRIKYLMAFPQLIRLIREYQPDIIHSHYATSYGLLGALCRFKPFILSVWGSDIYIFPNKTALHKLLIKYNLSMASSILSTSNALAVETKKYTNKLIVVTPFGINMNIFRPIENVVNVFDKNDIVIGTVKSLEDVYGIDYLIEAFNVLKRRYSDIPIKLLLVGGGTKEMHLKNVVSNYGLENDTVFTGRVSYNEVPIYQNMLSIYVALSLSESFGVSVIEASACEKPVVVSNVGGLLEVVENGVTGFIVESKNVDQAVEALEKLILNEDLRRAMGKAGRKRVEMLYNFENNVNQMIAIYNQSLSD